MKNKVHIFDNGGKTADRYTIVLSDGEVFGCSAYPFHSQGIGQYCGNVCELWHGSKAQELCLNNRTHTWKKVCVKIAMDALLKSWRQTNGEINIRFEDAPADVQQYIKQISAYS